ncbi:MAG: hypothetical protein H6679_05515 [Epsilonproteobacteria bacterium]|nr:hypothetical protein [Campylobacterota bacterium]
MKQWMRYMLTILGITMLVLVARKTFLVIKNRFFTEQSDLISSMRKDFSKNEGMVFRREMRRQVNYNFKRLLDLVEHVQRLRKFYAQRYKDGEIDTMHEGREFFDDRELEDLLAELYREKLRFRNYIWEVKRRSRYPISAKRYRSLLYYQKVIEDGISFVEMLIRQM